MDRKYETLQFESLKHMQAEIKRNGWEHSKTALRFNDEWTYGSHFDNYDTHMLALNHGRTSPSLMRHYKKIRNMLERKLKVSKQLNMQVKVFHVNVNADLQMMETK